MKRVSSKKVLTLETINDGVERMEYAVCSSPR